MFLAVSWNAPVLLEFLLQNGSDVNSLDDSKQTALHIAVQLKAVECVKVRDAVS